MFNLVIFSGPSGAGKSTIIKSILSKYNNFILSTSATTRQIRAGEVDGVDYFFISPQDFERQIESGGLFEYVKIFDNYYGTLKDFIISNILYKDIILDLDYIGFQKIKQEISTYNQTTLLQKKINLTSIFIKPKFLDDLRQRLEVRGETKKSIETRIARAEEEIKNSKMYNFCIENDVLNDTIKQVEDIFISQKLI